MVKVKVIGCFYRKLILLFVMINVWCKFFFIKLFKIKLSRRGVSGKFVRCRVIVFIVIRIIIYIFMVLNDIKYMLVMEKNRIIGNSIVCGIVSSLEMYGIKGKLRISSMMLFMYIEMMID